MENNALLAKKSLGKKNIKYLIIVLVAIIFIASFFIYYLLKGPANIADCKDLECVRIFASDENFILEDCEKVMPEFKDNCYFIFGTENPKAKERKVSEYCLPILDGDLYANCYEYSTGGFMASPNDEKYLNFAINNLDESYCYKLRKEELKKSCLNQLSVILEAIEKKDLSLCDYRNEELSSASRNTCLRMVSKVIFELKK